MFLFKKNFFGQNFSSNHIFLGLKKMLVKNIFVVKQFFWVEKIFGWKNFGWKKNVKQIFFWFRRILLAEKMSSHKHFALFPGLAIVATNVVASWPAERRTDWNADRRPHVPISLWFSWGSFYINQRKEELFSFRPPPNLFCLSCQIQYSKQILRQFTHPISYLKYWKNEFP